VIKHLRNIILFAILTATVSAVSSAAFAGNSQSLRAFEGLLAAYDSVESYRPTLGIELEGVFKGATREEAFNSVEKIILEKVAPIIHPGADVRLERYEFKTARGQDRSGTKVIFDLKDGTQAVWEVKDDGSIEPKAGYIGVEVVSPILRTVSDVKGAEKLIELLAAAGFEAAPSSAALQVHAGFTLDGKKLSKTGITKKEMTAQTLLLIWFFSKFEKDLIAHYEVHPKRAHFAKPTPNEIINQISSGKLDLHNLNLNDFIEKNYDYKYWALNTRALFRFGTFEIRFMNSTTDKKQIQQLVDLAIAVAQAIKTKDPAMIKLMTDHIDSDITVAEVVGALKINSISKGLVSKVLPFAPVKLSQQASHAKSCAAAVGE
jgi:hypothetical protein